MKWEYWIIILTLIVEISLGWIFELHTRISDQQDRIAKLENYIGQKRTAEAQALKLSAPLEQYRVSSNCGIRKDPMGGNEDGFHKGTDFVGPKGCPIRAAADGVVIDHWPAPGTPCPTGGVYRGDPVFGCKVILYHGDGISTLYGHMKESTVHIGDAVKRGQIIGYQGSTGISVGEHLHFEVIVDPEATLRGVLPRDRASW